MSKISVDLSEVTQVRKLTKTGSNSYSISYPKLLKINGSIAWVKQGTLTLSKGTGVDSITATRNTSPYQNASTGGVSSGGTIYYGDTFTISASAKTGYTLNSYTTSFTVEDAYPSINKTISVGATLNSYTLTKKTNTGVSSVTVSRTSSPYAGASTGNLSNGATIYYGDKLSVSATASSGYALNSYTTSYTVTGNITVAPTAYQTAPTLSAPVVTCDIEFEDRNPTGWVTITIQNNNNVSVNCGVLLESYCLYNGGGSEEFIKDYDDSFTISANNYTRFRAYMDFGYYYSTSHSYWVGTSVSFSASGYNSSHTGFITDV